MPENDDRDAGIAPEVSERSYLDVGSRFHQPRTGAGQYVCQCGIRDPKPRSFGRNNCAEPPVATLRRRAFVIERASGSRHGRPRRGGTRISDAERGHGPGA